MSPRAVKFQVRESTRRPSLPTWFAIAVPGAALPASCLPYPWGQSSASPSHTPERLQVRHQRTWVEYQHHAFILVPSTGEYMPGRRGRWTQRLEGCHRGFIFRQHVYIVGDKPGAGTVGGFDKYRALPVSTTRRT